MLPKKNSATNNPARDRIVVHPAYCHHFTSLQKLRDSPELREHPICPIRRSKKPVRRSKPIRFGKMRRTNPIRMFRRPVRNTGTPTKELRIDTPHVERTAGGRGITSKATNQPALERMMRGRKTLMNLSPIFGEQ
jgi:hypothetical protein